MERCSHIFELLFLLLLSLKLSCIMTTWQGKNKYNSYKIKKIKGNVWPEKEIRNLFI